MNPISSLLVATDFSTDSRYALQRAGLLCKASGVPHGIALHVVETGLLEKLKRLLHLSDDVESTLLDDARKNLDEATASVFERSNVRLDPQVRSGKTVDSIIDAAAGSEMVLLGAKSRHLYNSSIGSTPGRVIRQSDKPVLVVKSEPLHAYRKVLVAVDFSDHSRRAVEWAARIAPTAPLYLIHVYHAMFEGKMKYAYVTEDTISKYRSRAHDEARQEMDRFISGLTDVHRSRIHDMIRHGDHPTQTIIKAIRKTHADLVVAGKQGESLMERLFIGSVTLNLLELSPCDLLVTQ